jgi:hypothetical protein
LHHKINKGPDLKKVSPLESAESSKHGKYESVSDDTFRYDVPLMSESASTSVKLMKTGVSITISTPLYLVAIASVAGQL